jgi:putative ABC transport system permease protein
MAPLVMSARMRGNPAPLVARLPLMAADIDAGLHVQEARPLDDWIRQETRQEFGVVAALAGVTGLVLFLSALGIYSLISVSVSRRTREIGLRAALGANPRHVLAGILSRALVVLGSGLTVGGGVLLVFQEDNLAAFVVWLAVTAVVMLTAALLASIVPARRALRINPTEALRQT